MNTAEIVGKLNAEDPHPVARKDAADVAEFKASKYNVDATAALAKAKFVPPDPGLLEGHRGHPEGDGPGRRR